MYMIQALSNLGQRVTVPFQQRISKISTGLEMWVQRMGIFYIAMGYLLGRAMILQELSPFSPAYFVVVYFIRKDKVFLTTMALLLGAASQSSHHALIVFMNLALSFIILRLLGRWKKRELSHAPFVVFAAVFSSHTLYHYLMHSITTYSIMMNFVEGLLAAVLSLIFTQSLPFLTSKKYHHVLKTEEIVCVVILLASVMTGTVGWHLQGTSVQGILAKYLVVTLAFIGGGTVGSTVGVITGLIVSLADITLIPQIGVLAFAGLLAGLLKEGNRIGSVIGIITGSAILAFYAGDKQSILISLLETGVAAAAFVITPRFIMEYIARFVPGTEENAKSQYEYMRRVRDVTVGKVMKFSNLFLHLADAFNQVTAQCAAETQAQVDMGEFLARVTERTCQSCWKRDKCWSEQQIDSTLNMMEKLVQHQDTYGEINRESEDLRDYQIQCTNKDRMEQVIAEEYESVREQLLLQRQVEDSRKLVADQLSGISRVMKDFAGELQREGIDLSVQEQQILSALESVGLSVQKVNILSLEEGKVDIEITQPACDARHQCESIIAPMLTSIVGENIALKSKECDDVDDGTCTVILGSEKNFLVSSYGTGIAKDGRLVSGDCFMTMELGNGKYVMAISDGMGNGDRAHLESASTLQLLKELLEVGLDETLAIKSVNTVLSLRTPEEMFATVDLAIVDQYSGTTKFIKTGSIPSFVKRGTEVFTIAANNLPIGIIEDIDVDVVTETLKPGDLLIMVSDGLIEAPAQIENKEMWFRRIISELRTDNPEEIADLLLERVIRSKYGDINDDMTILVSRVDQCVPKWGTFSLPGVDPIQRPKRVS